MRARNAYYRIRYRLVPTVVHAWRNVFCYKDIRLSTMNYDEYWEGGHSVGLAHDARRDVFLQLVERGSTVAEIGSGDGTLLLTLRQQRDAIVKGYDVSSRAVELAARKGLDVEVRDASASGLDSTYDYVIIADCLEHLPEPEKLVQRLSGCFRKALLISIPNSCYWRYRFRVLFGRFMMQWVAHPGEHLRYWSVADMRWWLGQLGVHEVRTYPAWGIPVLKHLWPSMFAQNVVYAISPGSTHTAGQEERPAPAVGSANRA